MINIILIIASIIISIIGITYVYIKRQNFGNKLTLFVNVLLYLFLGIFFFTSFSLSTETYFTENIVLIFWVMSIIFWIFSITMLSVIHKLIIKFEEKEIVYIIFYALIIGIILGLVFIANSFTIKSFSGSYNYIFQNLILLVFLLCYNVLIIGVMCYNLIKYYSSIRDKRSRKILSILTSQFCIIISLYSVYIVTQNILFRYLYVAFYLIGACYATYSIVKTPYLYIELTNRIHDFIIFHKSGILLYSYNFETGEDSDESLLKGSILIGINHILSNLIDKKDQLGLIKMQKRDIILEYDNNHGYALLLTANHKNAYIDKAVNNFMNKFTSLNKEKLKNLHGLIDVSEFRNAKNIILEFFEPFVIKKLGKS